MSAGYLLEMVKKKKASQVIDTNPELSKEETPVTHEKTLPDKPPEPKQSVAGGLLEAAATTIDTTDIPVNPSDPNTASGQSNTVNPGLPPSAINGQPNQEITNTVQTGKPAGGNNIVNPGTTPANPPLSQSAVLTPFPMSAPSSILSHNEDNKNFIHFQGWVKYFRFQAAVDIKNKPRNFFKNDKFNKQTTTNPKVDEVKFK
jgi:hypothetical protein